MLGPTLKSMSTIHNPVNFLPQDYEVFDYVDNEPPKYVFGMPYEAYEIVRKSWENDLIRAFGTSEEKWIEERQSEAFIAALAMSHKCVHCGNGRVRYVTAVTHIPTGKRVCFGADCTHRLGFKDEKAFREEIIRSRAHAQAENFKIYVRANKWLDEHEGARAIIEKAISRQGQNSFVDDVVAKLWKYGGLSDKQFAAIGLAMDRDDARQARIEAEKAKLANVAPLGEGRVTLQGIILSRRYETVPGFGYRGSEQTLLKLLVQLDDGSKVWGNAPGSIEWDSIVVGARVSFSATVTRSEKDAHFGFFKRPSKFTVIAATVAQNP